LTPLTSAASSTRVDTTERNEAAVTNVKSRRATVEDDNGEGDEPVLSPDFAPGGDADYFAEEDEDGRFYGGGLTNEQKEILNIFDNSEDQVPDDVRRVNKYA